MSTTPRPLDRARTWAASTLLAAVVGTAALGYHIADVQSQTLASSASATTSTTSGTSSTSAATGSSSGLGSGTGQAQASTHGS